MVFESSMTRTLRPLRWELVSFTRGPLLNKQKEPRAALLKCNAIGQADGRFNISVYPLLCRSRHVFEDGFSMTQPFRFAVVMDPIAKIKFAKDSTLAMLLAAAARGWELTYFEQQDLWLRDGVAMGRGRPLRVFADPARWFELGEAR